MAILVIEEGAPNGTDLVVGEHRFNGVARANAAPQKAVAVLDIGEGYALVGLGLEPMLSDGKDGDHDLCAVLTIVGGKKSELVPMRPVKLILGEVGRIPLKDLQGMLERALAPKEIA